MNIREGWINWKKAVPRYRPDGSPYDIDPDLRGRTPTGSIPAGMTRCRAMSENKLTSIAPTPEEFTTSTPAQGLEREMDWEALDARLDQVQQEEADLQLTRAAFAGLEEKEEQDYIRGVEEQQSREASEARTPSSSDASNNKSERAQPIGTGESEGT